MLEPHYDEPPSAHAEIEIRLGPALPSITARTTVPGPDAKRLIRLLGFALTVLALLATVGVGTWSGAPAPVVALLAIVVTAFGVTATMHE